MFERIYNILVLILGDSKQGYYSSDRDQYQFNCPQCAEENGGVPDGKFNLEVNLQYLKYHCWKCGDTDNMKGNVRSLIKKYGSKTLYKQFKDELKALKALKLYDFLPLDEKTIKDNEFYLKLPMTFQKINLDKCTNAKLKDYLIKRRIDQKIIDKFNIGYTTWDETDYYWRNRIIVPSYDEFGDLNYYVGRDFTNKAKAKYKNCDSDKKEIIYQESLINFDADIILCEGVFDSLYPPNAISLLGKSLSKDSVLYKALLKKANGRIIICLDNDTDINETKKIYSLLNFGRLKNKIWYIRLNKHKDFGELYEDLGKKGVIKAINSSKQFNEIDLLWE